MKRNKIWLSLALSLLLALAPAFAFAFSGTVQLKINLTDSGSTDLSSATDVVAKSYTWTFTDGTGSLAAQAIFHDQRTISASSSETLDLAGSLTDALGNTLTFTKIKGIIVKADSGNTNDVQVGGNGSNQFINWVADGTDIVNVGPNGVLVLIAPDSDGYAVTASTGDILKIANSSSGTGVTYDIYIFGEAS